MQFEKHVKSLLVVSALMLIITSSLHATPIVDPNTDPFGYFNVYSLGDITYYNSDFEGKAGAAGNISFTNFSLGLLDPGGYALHAGGSVTFGPGSFYGSIEAGGDVSVGSMGISGDIFSGGNVSNFGGGTISGDVYAVGNITIDSSIFLPAIRRHEGASYTSTANHAYLSAYFTNYSSMVGLMSDNGTYTYIGGSTNELTFEIKTGINVISIDASLLNEAKSVKVTGPDDAILYINVNGITASLDNANWFYLNGILAENVLLNYKNAASLNMIKSNNVNILAPFATTTYTSGVVIGNLIVGNLSGSPAPGGQVNLGHFSAPSPVPEPATMLLFGTGLVGLATRLRRKSHKKNH